MSRPKIIILIGFGSVLLLVSLLIFFSISYLNKSKSQLDLIVNSNNLKIHLVNKMHQSARERTVSLFLMMIVDGEDEYEKHLDNMRIHGGEFMTDWEKFISLNLSPDEKTMFDRQAVISNEVGPIHVQIADMINFGELEQARDLLISKADPMQDEVLSLLLQLQEIQRHDNAIAIQRNSDNYREIVRIVWIVTFIVFFICISIIYFTLKLISNAEKEQASYQQHIEYQAYYDHLTALPNRRLLDDRIQHAIDLSKRNDVLMAVLFIDCDRFKPINDSLGHVVGDHLLISISDRLRKSIRSSDTVCRVSGDEFAIVLENVTNTSVIDKIAQAILDSVASPHIVEGHKVFTTVSTGITIYPHDDENVTGLFSSADIAMYHAKQNGGNQYVYFSPEMNALSEQRLTLERDLHEALTNNEFELYFQPQCTIDSQRTIVGVEALIRWHHPELGIISPEDFISIAEETGLIVSIGEWVLTTACKKIKEWERLGYKELVVSVNLSPRQFLHSRLVSDIKDAIKTSGIKPSQLDLEITESTAMGSINDSVKILHTLKSLGINLSIDDFGTGYSSLSYLQTMPIDTLKIDRSFVKNLHQSEKDKAFIQAIVTMAQTLGMKVIAEGVETEQQFKFLQEMGCELCQGYLLSKPVPEEKLKQLLKRSN